MPLNEPGWWYGTGALNAWKAQALSPVSYLYGWISKRRMNQTNRLKVGIPVICVGNFTAGGTGKTPFVCWLVEVLKQQNTKPAILTRGFGGRLAGPIWVDRSCHTAGEVGDEPLLLAQHAPVMVARHRDQGLQMIAQEGKKFDVVIMDDGLQNPSVAKDFSIAVVDGKRGFGNGRVIPAGPLRASLSVQAPRVAVVIINQGSRPETSTSSIDTITRQLRANGFQGRVMGATVSVSAETATLNNARVLAYAGIGHPERFFETIRSLGADLVEQRVFADHHEMTSGEAQTLLQSAASQNLTLVTTEKDWVRLSVQDSAIKELKAVSRVVPIRMEISDHDRGKIISLLEKCVAPNTR